MVGYNNTQKREKYSFFNLFIAVFFLLSIQNLSVEGLRNTKNRILESEHWASTTATVLSSGVNYKTKPYLLVMEKYGYQPSIRYSYEVNNRRFVSDQHWYDNDAVYSITTQPRSVVLYKDMLVKDYIAQNYPAGKKYLSSTTQITPQNRY